MVDDPSERTDVLHRDPALKRGANKELGKRREAWNKRKAAQEEALRQGNQAAPDPGPEPTLEESAADIERERLFAIIRQLVLWENTTNETVLQRHHDEIWQSWRYACAANTDRPHVPANSSTVTSCLPSTTPSPAAVRCRWRRNDWGWKPMHPESQPGGRPNQQGHDRDST